VKDSAVVAAAALAHGRYWATLLGLPDTLAILVLATGAPEKVALAAMERTLQKGLVDHGVSLRTAWPTPEGLRWMAEALATPPFDSVLWAKP
jgi:hypothetical protein